MAEVFRAFGEPHALDDRPFASRGLIAPEIDELGGTDLLWQALNGSILQLLEGISLADIAPAPDGASSEHVGHKVHW